MARDTLPLPFGGGLDLATGNVAVEPSSMLQLENVALVRARTTLRPGLNETLNIGWGTDVVGVFPVRASGVAGVVVFDSATHEVKLYIVDATGTTATEIGLLWTLDANATLPPRVSGADAYDKLFIAHDETALVYRQATYVFDPSASTLTTLDLDLDRSGATHPVKFKGVKRYLTYLVGWGYGTHAVEDRPEVLRISLPGQPTTFNPEHYFIVGARGEPIMSVAKSGAVLALRKPSESYKLVGYDRKTFGVEPLDPVAGCAGAQLDVEVEGVDYFWSEVGPRSASGDASSDLAFPLNITGDVADIADPEAGFAFYDRAAREVVFVFADHSGNAFAYVLHLRDGTPRWSRRTYGVPLRCVGTIWTGGSTGLALTATPLLDAATAAEPTYADLAHSKPTLTVPWHFAGALAGTEHLEVWVRSAYDSVWYRAVDVAAPALGTVTFEVEHFLAHYDLAIRLTVGGVGQAGYTNADPTLWPAAAQGTVVTGGSLTATGLGGFARTSALAVARALTRTGMGLYGAHPELTYETMFSRDGGATWESSVTSAAGVWPTVAHPNADLDVTFLYRVMVHGPSATAGWYACGSIKLQPAAPADPYHDVGGVVGGGWHAHDCHFLTYGSDGGDVELRARHVSPDQAYSATVVLVNPALDALGLHVPTPANGLDEVEVSIRTALTAFGVTDYSDWVASTAT